ncbi:MAG: TonB family protein [Geminicoccaceae bacterium]
MSGFSKAQWLLALSITALIHAGVAVFLLRSPPSSGSIATGAGGITVALGPAGRAPGAVETVSPPVAPANVEPLEDLEVTLVDRQPEETKPEELDDVRASEPDELVIAEATSEIASNNVEEARAKEPDTTAPEPARTVEVPNASTTATEEGAESQPSETIPSDNEAIDLAENAELEAAEEVAAPDASVSDAPNDVVPSSTEAVAELPEELVPTPQRQSVTEAAEIAPEDVATRSSDPTPSTAGILPPPPKPSASEVAPEDVQPEAQPEPPQLTGAGGEAGDQDQGDLGSGQNPSGGGVAGAKADYFVVLQAWLEQHKVYPRRALSRRLEGVVSLRFVMDREGQVLDYQVERSSGHRLLDRAVKTLIERAQPLPMMPDEIEGANLTFVVPISFVLN